MVLIIAEAGINHCGDIERALKMVSVAKMAGADIVKFQSFAVDELGYAPDVTEMLRPWQLSVDDHVRLFEACANEGIEFMSTPFHRSWVGFLKGLGVKRIKISSGMANNADFLKSVAYFDLPVIMSLRPGALKSPGVAIHPCLNRSNLSLLYCVSKYPTPVEDIDLGAFATMRHAFQLPVGFSDHTEGWCMAVRAVRHGAEIVEKHFTLDRSLPGPDQVCSVEPDELAAMVRAIRAQGVGL